MKLVGNITLLSDLTLCTSQRVVLRENGDGFSKMLEEVVLALCHFLHIRLCPLVCGKLMVHYQQAFVIQYVPVIIVV